MKFKVVQFDYTRNVPMCAKGGGVQLWENGPYWAECNIGATKPEEPGYYFWWGDTVGYKPEGGKIDSAWNSKYDVTWVPVKDGTVFEFNDVNHPTYGKSISQLWSAGYIDSTGNLAAAHDAAAAHWGDGWRMPTAADFDEMIKMCNLWCTTCIDVKGFVVTGKGAYESKSIFLPVGGYGLDSGLHGLGFNPKSLGDGACGSYWSSTPNSNNPDDAWYLHFNLGQFFKYDYYRYGGQLVRPVRGFAK